MMGCRGNAPMLPDNVKTDVRGSTNVKGDHESSPQVESSFNTPPQ